MNRQSTANYLDLGSFCRKTLHAHKVPRFGRGGRISGFRRGGGKCHFFGGALGIFLIDLWCRAPKAPEARGDMKFETLATIRTGRDKFGGILGVTLAGHATPQIKHENAQKISPQVSPNFSPRLVIRHAPQAHPNPQIIKVTQEVTQK